MQKKQNQKPLAEAGKDAVAAFRKEKKAWKEFRLETRQMQDLALPLLRCRQEGLFAKLGPTRDESWNAWAERTDVNQAVITWLVDAVRPACIAIRKSKWTAESLLDVNVGKKPEVLLKLESFMAMLLLRLINAPEDSEVLNQVARELNSVVRKEPETMEHLLRFFQFLSAQVTQRRPDTIDGYDCILPKSAGGLGENKLLSVEDAEDELKIKRSTYYAYKRELKAKRELPSRKNLRQMKCDKAKKSRANR